MKNYEKIKEEILNAARKIDESLYYTIDDMGLDITSYTDTLGISDDDIEAVERIIYNHELTKDDINAAMNVVDNVSNKLNELNIQDKLDNIYSATNAMQACIDAGALDADSDCVQAIIKTIEKWCLIYLWHEYIFKNVKKFIVNMKYGRFGEIE